MKTSDFFNWIRRSQIVRSDQRWLGGVCSGLANRLGWDVALVRVLMVVLVLMGAGLFVYPLAWILLPNMSGEILAEDLLKGHGGGEAVGVLIFLIFGALTTTITFWGLITVGLFFALIGYAVNQAENPQNWQQQAAPGAPQAAPYLAAGSAMPNAAAGAAGAGQAPINNAYMAAPPLYTTPAAAPIQHVEQERIIHTRKSGGAFLRFLMWGVIFLSGGLAYIAGILMNIAHDDYLAWGRLFLMWAAGVTIFICLITLVLALRGRKTAGYAWLGACGVIFCMMCGAVFGFQGRYVHYANSDSGRMYTYANRYNVRDGQIIKLTKNLVTSLNKGTLFTSTSKFHTPHATLDMTNWKEVMGEHTWTKSDGSQVQSSCPTGDFNIAVNGVKLTILVPRDCSYSREIYGDIVGGYHLNNEWYDRIYEEVNHKYVTRFRNLLSDKKKELQDSNGLDDEASEYNDFDFLTDNDDSDWYNQWEEISDYSDFASSASTLGDEYERELDNRLQHDIEMHIDAFSLFGSINIKKG